jgi:glycosyltransferase involved in cell wall biosynthesis
LHLSLVLNAHREGSLVVESIRSAIEAQATARTKSINVELILVLDKGDKKTRNFVCEFQNNLEIFEVDFGDLGEARNFGRDKSRGEYLAFLDCDDLISDNWLTDAYSLYGSLKRDAILHPELNYFFGPRLVSASRLLFKHRSSLEASFSYATLTDQNPWTALCFSRREVFVKHPYREIDLRNGIGFEDWNFNLETLSSGLPHLVVPGTIHFIRQKGVKSLKRRSARANVRIREMRNLRKLALGLPELGTD